MKGYYLDSVYMGYIPNENKYIPFPSENEYIDYFRDSQ